MAKRPGRRPPELDAQTAEQILETIFKKSGVKPNSVPMEALSAYTVYRKERFYLQRGILTAILVLFFLLPFLFIDSRYTVEEGDSGVRGLPVYTIRIASLLPPGSVRAQLKNRNLPVYEVDGKTFTIEPTRNGAMKLSVELVNRQRTETEVKVTGVDENGPRLLRYEAVGREVYLYIQDDGIGTDYDETYALTAEGKIIRPLRTDREAGLIVYDYPDGRWDVYIPDHIGNTLHLAMKIEPMEE
ncbi:MAG: hypothetical protein IJV26_07935 [Lachnospiraceae bacterium]|nr:hypothetical protein [Lachnospiraceae bacterium]